MVRAVLTPGNVVRSVAGWPQMHREVRVVGEFLSTREPETWPDPPEGRGRPALLVPGFLAGDASLTRMARWLKRGGFAAARTGITSNVGCMTPVVDDLERRLEEMVAQSGSRALVVGQSRGGTIGRVLAVRRPDLVETLVTLGSPVRDQLAVHPALWGPISAVGLLGTLRVPGFFSASCRNGACCEAARDDLLAPFPDDVRLIAVYSRNDGVVRWRACIDERAEPVEVTSTHNGMGLDRAVWRELAERL